MSSEHEAANEHGLRGWYAPSSPLIQRPIRAAIFDWAGTVLDFGSIAPVASFCQIFEDAGVRMSEAEARAPMGAAKREHVALNLQNPAVRTRWQTSRGELPHERDIDTLYAEFLRVEHLTPSATAP
jgi:phosphonoacetaldehyde hydrolase